MLSYKDARGCQEALELGSSLRSLGKKYGVSYVTIRSNMIKHGFIGKGVQGKTKPLLHCFEDLATTMDRYWYGYFMGDATVSMNTISLSSIDKEHLELFISHYNLSSRVNISKKKGVYLITLNSKELVSRCVDIGLINHKSLRCFKCFDVFVARGLFDADGCLSNSRYRLTGCQHYIEKFIELVGISNYCLRERGVSNELSYTSREQRNYLYKLLYAGGGVSLSRKHSVAAFIYKSDVDYRGRRHGKGIEFIR